MVSISRERGGAQKPVLRRRKAGTEAKGSWAKEGKAESRDHEPVTAAPSVLNATAEVEEKDKKEDPSAAAQTPAIQAEAAELNPATVTRFT